MVERLVLVVLAGLKLLDLEALDSGAAGFGVEFDFFHLEFRSEQRVVGLADGGLIAGELGFCPGFVDGQFFKVFGQCQQAAVTVLEDQQGADFVKHGYG